MTVEKLSELCSFDVCTMPEPDKEIKGAYIGDLLSWVMGRATEGNVWITIMSNVNTIAVASLADVSCILISERVTVDDELLKTAKAKGVNVLSSKVASYETALDVARVING